MRHPGKSEVVVVVEAFQEWKANEYRVEGKDLPGEDLSLIMLGGQDGYKRTAAEWLTSHLETCCHIKCSEFVLVMTNQASAGAVPGHACGEGARIVQSTHSPLSLPSQTYSSWFHFTCIRMSL